jgi:sn1-specific diacylglycerol lipase
MSRFRVSSRGSPTETEERKALSWLCTIKLIPLSFLRVITVLLAMYTLTTVKRFCDPESYSECFIQPIRDIDAATDKIEQLCPKSTNGMIALLAYIYITELSVVALVAAWVMYGNVRKRRRKIYHWWNTTKVPFCCRRQQHRPEFHRSMATSDMATTTSSMSWWHNLCRCCCACTSCCTCCLFGGYEVFRSSNSNDSSLSDISMILSDFFNTGNNLDVTPSDLLVGLTGLRLEQRDKRSEKVKKLLSESEPPEDLTNTDGECREQPVRDLEESYSLSVFDNDIEEGSQGVLSVQSFATGSFQLVEQGKSDENQSSDGTLMVHCGGGSDTHSHSIKVVLDLQMCRANSQVFFKVTKRRILDFTNEMDRRVIQDGAYYMRYAAAVYGHVLYLATHTCTAPCCLLAGVVSCRGRSCFDKRNERDTDVGVEIVGDGIFGCNQLGFLFSVGLYHTDLAYASFKKGIKACPYVIAIDREKKSVVLTIQGTFSLESLVADLNVRPVPMQLYADKCDAFAAPSMANEYCHSGMLQCALHLYRELERHKTLDQLLLGERAKLPGYSLVLTGHSLGAGCAAILSKMLRGKFPDLQCLCFAPPGCVVSLAAAQDRKITSYVLDTDLVPRLSVESVVGLRNDLLEMIARVKVPKHEILSKNSAANSDFAHQRDSIPLSRYYAQVLEFKDHQDRLTIERKTPDIRLYPPGRLVHLIENLAKINRGRKSPYIPVWAENKDFAEIQLTKSFLLNHVPLQYLQHLSDLALSLQE